MTGSYRRNLQDSGDIDILITHKDDPTDYETLFKKIVNLLIKDKYIVDTFALGNKKCMAICKLQAHDIYRRIDLLYTRKQEFPFALLYFTGSQEFNIDMRNIALSKGYSLNEYGLKDKDTDEFVDHKFESEHDVFEFLELEYVEPEARKKNVLKAKE